MGKHVPADVPDVDPTSVTYAPPAAGQIVRTKQAAEYLGVSEQTMRWWRHQGRGPRGFRLGGRIVVYRLSELDRWLAEQEAAGTDGVA